MNKTFTKNLLFFILFILFASTKSYSQTITIGTVDSGPYGQGSSIAVPITVNDASGCVLPGNVYNVYLSDASGNFASGGTLIGSYTGFYATFVNGIIPTNAAAGTGYRVMVKSTSPVASSAPSAPFEIKAVAGVKASIMSTSLIGTDPEIFGTCTPNYDATDPSQNTTYNIMNTSAANTTTTASFVNESNKNPETGTGSIANPGDSYTFTPTGYFNYTVSARTLNSTGIVGTHDYQLINNVLRTNIGSTGNGYVCLSNGEGVLSFNIDVSSAGGGVQVNYPGDTYLLTWGDGSSTTFTFCQLKALNGIVSHTFVLPSCQATPGIGGANVFYVTAKSQSPYCTSTGTAPGVSAKVLIKAVTDFTFPATACVGQPVTLNNTSKPGPDPNNTTTQSCTDNPATLYDWYIDGTLVSGTAGYTLTQKLVLPATIASGTHTITLHQRNSYCGGADQSHTICYENPPKPSFTIAPTTVCASATSPVIPVNTSITDATCSVAQYVWTVTGPTGATVGYANGTSASSQTPQFLFTKAGVYTVTLGVVSAGCGTITSGPTTITVDASPAATMSPALTLCGAGQTLTFGPTQTNTKTTFSGTTTAIASTYAWTVTGGAYSFVGGTNANTQYPQIKFTDDAVYTVSVTNTNSCGTATASQQITFKEAPTVVAGTVAAICTNGTAILGTGASVTGNYTSYQWTGGAGTFSPNRTTLNATYTPTALEASSGQVILTLQANSSLPAPCNVVTSPVTITITPVDHVTSAGTAQVCSGQAMNYAITADHTPSTYTWSVTATTGSPSGYTASGTGSSITDVLTNTGNADATVTYTIIPTYKGCAGVAFPLKVTVHPFPVITAGPVNAVICNNQPANIVFQSNLTSGTTYTWTAANVPGVTGYTNQTTAIAALNGIQDLLSNSTINPQVVTYQITPYNGTCAGPTISAQVTIGPNIVSNAGTDQSICGGDTYQLDANTPVIGTGKWDVIQGPASAGFVDDTDPKTKAINLIPGNTYKFRWTVSLGACAPVPSVVTIEDDIPTVAGSAKTNDPTMVCSGSGSGHIFIDGNTGSILGWESSTDGTNYNAVTPATTDPLLPFSNLLQTTWYRAIIQNGVNCAVLRSDPVKITVVQPPVASIPGPNESVCNATEYTLKANNPSPGTGTWTVPLGSPSASFVDIHDPNTKAIGLTPGTTYQFTWTTYGYTPDGSTSPCAANSQTVQITDEIPATGGAASGSVTVCDDGTNHGNILLGGQLGNVVNWESSTDGIHYNPVSPVNTTTLLQFSGLTQTTWYHALVQNGVSCGIVASDPATVTVVPQPTISNAGPNDRICAGTTYVLQGNTPVFGTGKWTVTQGTGVTFVDPTNPITEVDNLVPGNTYTFKWTIITASSSGVSSCEPSFSLVQIIDDKATFGGAANGTTTVCSDGNTGNVTLTGNQGGVVNWESSTDGTHYNAVSPVNTSTSLQYTNLTQTTWYRAEVQSGPQCLILPSDPAIITVVDPPVTANAGPNVPLCNETSYTLQGNSPGTGTGLWTITAGPTTATFDDPTSPTAKVSNLIAGNTYGFTWTITGYSPTGLHPCATSSSTVTITDNTGAFGGTATANPAVVCAGTTGGTISLSGQAGTIIGWESSTDGGNTWTPMATTGPAFNFPALTQTTEYHALLNSGNCNSISDPAIVTVVPQPTAAKAGADERICNETTYTLHGNTPTSGTGKWTVTPGYPSANFVNDADPNTVVNGLTPGNSYQFTWTITTAAPNGVVPCPPSPSAVNIVDELLPVGTITGTATVCTGNNAGQLNLTGQYTTIVRWELSIDNGASWSPIGNTTNINNYFNLAQTTQYRAIVLNGPKCGEQPSNVITITVVPPPTTANAGPADHICSKTSYKLQGNTPGAGNNGLWTVTSGQTGVTFDDATSPTATAANLIPGNTYEFTWTISATGSTCSPSPSSVKIIDDQAPAGGQTAGEVTVCAGSNSGQVTLSNQFGTITWESSTDGNNWTPTGNTGTTQPYSNLTQTTWYHAVLRNGSVCDPDISTPTKISVAQPPVTANAGAGAEVCNVDHYDLQGNNPGTGTGLWTVTSGPAGATFDDATKPNARVSNLVAGNTYQFTWTITGSSPTSVQPCSPSPSTVQIIIDKPATKGTMAGTATVCTGSNSGQIALSGQFGTIVRWESSTDGVTWAKITNTNDTQPYYGLTQTTIYRAILTNGVCGEITTDPVTITIVQPPVIANAGADESICNQVSHQLHANSPGTGTGLWTVAPGYPNATFDDATNPNATVSGLIAGNTYKFTWTITGFSPTGLYPCSTSPSTVQIIDDLPAQGGQTAGATTVCAGGNSGQITLSSQFGTIVRWESSTDNGVTWTRINNKTDTQPYFNLTQTTLYQAIVTNGVCGEMPSQTTTISVAQPPVTANAGAGTEVCNVDHYDLQGNSPGTGTGLWTVTSGPAGATFDDATKPNARVSNLIAGNTYQFTWTITGYSPTAAQPCSPSPSTVQIIDDLPAKGGETTGAITVCAGSNSGQITLANQLGTIVRWESSTDGVNWTRITNTTNTQPYYGLTQTTTYHAVVTNGVCGEAISLPTTISVAQPPVTANAGADESICNQTSHQLHANNPGTGTGLWTVTLGYPNATFDDATNPNATVSGLVAGTTYKFTWTITGYSPTTDHPCATSPSTVQIIDYLPAKGGKTSSDATVCISNNSGQITLSEQFGTIVRWESSTNNGVTWTTINNNTDTQPYFSLTTTTIYRAVVTNGSCGEMPSLPTTITVIPLPVVANAGAGVELCAADHYNLQGNSPGTGTGKWTITSGPTTATFDDPTSPTAKVSNLIAGNTYEFTWTINSFSPTGIYPCLPSTSTVRIINDQKPVGGTTTGDATVCSGSNAGQITIMGQFGTIQWVSSVDNGLTWNSTNNSSTTQSYSGLTQTTQYMAILSNGSVCGVDKSTITTITIGAPPIVSNPGPDAHVCGLTEYRLQANSPGTGAGKWTIASGAGATFVDDSDPNTLVKGLIPGNTYKFTWTITNTSPCPPIPGTVVIINDLPAVGGIATAVPATVCYGSNSVVTLAGQSGNILRWESSTDGVNWQAVNVTGPTQTFSNLMQTTQFRAILLGQGTCGEVPSAAAVVAVNPLTVVSNPGANDEVCSVTTYKLNGNSPGAGTGLWTVTNGPSGSTFVDATDPKTVVNNLTPGNTYQFTWTITGAAPCPPSSNAVNITIDLQPIGGTTTGEATACSGDNGGTITLGGQFGTIKWQSSPDGTNWADIVGAAPATTYNYSNLMQTTSYRAVLTQPGKCGAAYSSVTTIKVNPKTVIADAGQSFNICNQSIAKLNANNPAPSTGMWTQTAGPVVAITDPASYQTVVTGLTKGNVYTFKWTIKGLAPCPNTEAYVTIGAYEDVTPSFTKTTDHSCGPVNVTFTNTSTPSPVGAFEWNFGDGTPIVTAVNPPTHSFAPSTDGTEKTYTVTLTPTSNCGSKTPFTDYIKVSPLNAVASLLPAQTSYCGAFTLTAKNMSPGNNAQYDFYLKDAKGNLVQHLRYNDKEDAVFQTITPTVATYYTVSVMATDQCGNQTTSTPVNVSVAPSNIVSGVQIKGDLGTICLGSPITFQNISTGGDRFSISIFDANKKLVVVLPSGVGDLNYTPTAIGTYYVSMVAGNTGCGDAPPSELKQFDVAPTPKPVFTYSTDNNYNITFYNNTHDVGGIPAPTLTYKWDFGDGSKNETAYLPNTHHFDASKSPFTVTLTATTPGTDCFDVTQQTISLQFHGDLYFPNAFIPASSNRELNTYRVKGFGMKTWHMQIFNNFGQLIWETTKLDSNGSPVDGWDGTYKGQIVQQGVYIWQISATLLNGEEWKGMSSNGSTPTKTGPIHLIR